MAAPVDADNWPVPIVAFDDFELDTGLFELRHAGRRVALEPQVFTVLAYLVDQRERVVTKAELLDHVWGDRFISEAALTSRLMAARKALGDDGRRQRYIKTVHGRGYRFAGDVRPESAPAAPALAAAPALPVDDGAGARQEIRFCTAADGTRIAYATSGAGPPLVKVANWLSHLEFDWRSPVWRHWLTQLSRDHTLVRYDERGCGLSDRNVDQFSVDAWVSDLEAVVDALDLERFPLLGISQGGPVAMTYAARHPERVSHLILYGSYALGRQLRAKTQDELDENEALITLIRLWWGKDDPTFRQFFARAFIPGGTPEHHRWFNDLCRVSASPEDAAGFRRAFGLIDVTALLPQVAVPTLVLHAIDDARVPIDQGRLLASSIPHARFVPLEGENHILLEGEPAWPRFLAEVRSFLDVPDAAGPAESHGIRTILFTDIEDSTPLTRRLGDDAAREIFREHEREVEGLIRIHGGGAVKQLGDGVMAAFDSGVRAVECAVAIGHAAARLASAHAIPFRVRVGIHAGDAIAEQGDLHGIAVITAARIAAHAAAGDILVSDVVRQLAAGKGFVFSPPESFLPKGFEQPIDVYRVAWE